LVPCATPQYNLRSATLARCATGHDRPESVVTIAGIRSMEIVFMFTRAAKDINSNLVTDEDLEV
jgi:hypothetical protein